jgi:hypothetical protein
LDAAYKDVNTPVAEAGQKASEQTISAFEELAPQIEVTNKYGGNGLVNPTEVVEALKAYRQQMQSLNYLMDTKSKDFDFDASAARAKQELKKRLIKASQKDAPRQTGPVL